MYFKGQLKAMIETDRIFVSVFYFYRGENPAEADVNLLDTARKVELYGIRMVPAKVSMATDNLYYYCLSYFCQIRYFLKIKISY